MITNNINNINNNNNDNNGDVDENNISNSNNVRIMIINISSNTTTPLDCLIKI